MVCCVSRSWHAQRKFASNDGSCATPEVKKKSTYVPRKLFADRKLKTEDFITFLCFRGNFAGFFSRYYIIIIIIITTQCQSN